MTSNISVNDLLQVKLIILWSLFKLIKLELAKNVIKKNVYNPSFEKEGTKHLGNSTLWAIKCKNENKLPQNFYLESIFFAVFVLKMLKPKN